VASALARSWLPVVAWAALIFGLSSVPDLGTGLGGWDLLLRKLAHVTEYAVLTFLWWRALHGLGLRAALPAAVAISLLYACTDEFHQTFVEGRHGTPVDVGVDSIGMAIAAVAIAAYARRRIRGPSRPMAA